MKVYVVVNLELGWDNIVGVFDWNKFSTEELEERFPKDDSYCIFQRTVETDLDNYE